MPRSWTVYIIHHSHTDIGYTDLQERVLYTQTDYIRTAIRLTRENPAFKWNCESWFCVEQFLADTTGEEKEAFFDMVRRNGMGISANYLNFNDLVDKDVLTARVGEVVALLKANGFTPRSAMTADINGVSMGYRDALLDGGIEFLYNNVHCHHGMYPLYQNQKPFFWEDGRGRKLLVFSGEHYNLGNTLGIVPPPVQNYMTRLYFGEQPPRDPVHSLADNLRKYLDECDRWGYPYDFIPISVSGVFSDNAPPNPEIPAMLQALEAVCPEIHMEMVTLDQLYEKIKPQLTDIPTYRGDINDWWANGVGSTPYAVKHYLDARRMHRLCNRLDPEGTRSRPEEVRRAEDNLLLYAEHTWGHSSTITDPADTMVQDLDIRKTSYASKAHEAAALRLNRITHSLGDKLRYYDRSGKVRAVNPTGRSGLFPVEFYIEAWAFAGIELKSECGEEVPAQVSPHPRGARVTFLDTFDAGQQKNYTYEERPKAALRDTTRTAFRGSEGVRDIVGDFDPVTYTLPYGIENKWYAISYRIGQGITSFRRKADNRELLKRDTPAS